MTAVLPTRWFRADPTDRAARALYAAAVAQARTESFYTGLGVPDSLDGRFELVVLHVFLLLRRLRRDGEAAQALSQRIFDVLFQDMDRSLREIGVADLSVGRHIKHMAQGFYGRVQAYDEALDSGVLEAVLRRNVYGTAAPVPAAVDALSAYVRASEAALAAGPCPSAERAPAWAPVPEAPNPEAAHG